MNQSRSLNSILGLILIIGLFLGLVFGNYRLAKQYISGEGFQIQWIGIHSLFNDGNSPYSDQVTQLIQQSVQSQDSYTGGNVTKYNSPLYSAIVVLPFALIDNSILAHSLWLTAQLAAVILILIIGLKLTGWKPAWYGFLIFILLTILSYHVFNPWMDGGLAIWASLFLALAFVSIRNGWNEVAGVFLGLAAIQPQMSILVIIFTLIWAGSQRKRILIIWFFMSIVILSILGLFLVPGWIMEYIRLLYKYQANFPNGSMGALFAESWPGLGKQLSWFVTFILAVVLVFEGWLTLKRDFRHFFWTACLFLVVTQWIGIPTIPANLIGLLLPFILVAALLSERWPRGGQWVAALLAFILFVWEWGLIYLNLHSSRTGSLLNLLIPLPFILLVGLYWVRWWTIKPKRMLLAELRYGESD